MIVLKLEKSTVDVRNHSEFTHLINFADALFAPKIWKFYPLI